MINSTDNVTDTRELDTVAGRAAHRADNRGVRHEIIYVAAMREGVPERQNLFAVDSGNRACRAQRKIAVDNRHAQSRARLKVCVEVKSAFKFRRSRLQIIQAQSLPQKFHAVSVEAAQI